MARPTNARIAASAPSRAARRSTWKLSPLQKESAEHQRRDRPGSVLITAGTEQTTSLTLLLITLQPSARVWRPYIGLCDNRVSAALVRGGSTCPLSPQASGNFAKCYT